MKIIPLAQSAVLSVGVALVVFLGAGLMAAHASDARADGLNVEAENEATTQAQNIPSNTAPTISSTSALNGAVIVTITPSQKNLTIYYTLDGTNPTPKSTVYEAPFLITQQTTVSAITVNKGVSSYIASSVYSPNIASGTLVWSDEFNNSSSSNKAPNSSVWAYDLGYRCCSDDELETYCAFNSSQSPCIASQPNVYVDPNGYLNLVARNPSPGVYTSGRIKTEHQFSFHYGRVEVRAKVPEGQGMWPAIWILGNNIDVPSINWPASGELDMMERIDGVTRPDWVQGTIHSADSHGNDAGLGTVYDFNSGASATGWHTYGIIWAPGSISYYVDTPTNPYVVLTPSIQASQAGGSWPFDQQQSAFLILNLAVGGGWPGKPSKATSFPATMQIDYVRIYQN